MAGVPPLAQAPASLTRKALRFFYHSPEGLRLTRIAPVLWDMPLLDRSAADSLCIGQV
jgi:hypothetical protein